MTKPKDGGDRLTPEFLAKITRSGTVEPALATMVMLGVPLTAEA